jgi:hypothetical protein
MPEVFQLHSDESGRLWPGEELLQKVMVDDHEFDY